MRTSPTFQYNLQFTALLSASVLLFILYFVGRESIPLINEVGISAFFADNGWYPLEGQYGLAPMLVGSLLVALGAIMIATPLGIIAAVFGQYYAPLPLAKIYQATIELLAGIPSVIFGFWGLIVLVPWINRIAPPGASMLAGIIVLAMMVLPLVILTTANALTRVPPTYLRSAQALGLSRWGIIYRIALPIAMPGILSGVVLQSGRALGETMAVMMVTGNVVQLPDSLFQPIRTLTANIALEMAYAVGDHRIALFVSGLLLLIITITLVVMAHYLKARRYGQ